jgi:hypothetical protein
MANFSDFHTLTKIDAWEYSGIYYNRAVYYTRANVPEGIVSYVHLSYYDSNGQLDPHIRGNFPLRIRFTYRQINGNGSPFLSNIEANMKVAYQNVFIEPKSFPPTYFSGQTSSLELEIDNPNITPTIANIIGHFYIILWMWSK